MSHGDPAIMYPLTFANAQSRRPMRQTPSTCANPPQKSSSNSFNPRGYAPSRTRIAVKSGTRIGSQIRLKHRIYASVVSPQKYSTRGAHFDLLRFARFLELFASCSPAHGYSLQVTFLGLVAILLGKSESLKREAAVAAA